MGNKNTTSESSIEDYFVRKCKAKAMKVIKMVPLHEAGIPDRQVLWQGVSGFAELKRPGKTARPLQQAYLKDLEKRGFFTGVVDSKEDADLWIECFEHHCSELLGNKVC
jgi:hypothetical protein